MSHTVKIPVYICYEPADRWNQDGPNVYSGLQFEASMYGNSATMVEYERRILEVVIPAGWDATAGIVGLLNKKKEQATQEFKEKIVEINEQLQKYLALGEN